VLSCVRNLFCVRRPIRWNPVGNVLASCNVKPSVGSATHMQLLSSLSASDTLPEFKGR